ncbi:AraC family transcriptional regulator [Amphritea opalescens]|uniref:AraC family transcriptional regulator n=1 Tax=Amphritea opalescens TaxID=2490544 RepID=A0A430KPE0_9GAMM|nr:AraC family transcriptional regulator [Amphritea opalescens]RTE65326.1 AraC family transcriptional regulator [Amphritea opalescens]
MSRAHIANHYLQASIRGAQRQGFDAAELLTAAKIPPEWLNQPSKLITEQQLAGLIKTVWRATHDEFMGLTSRQCQIGTFGLMAEYCLPSQTLGAMLRKSARFYNTICPDVDLALEEASKDENLVFLRLMLKDNTTDPDHFLQEFIMLMWQRFSCWLVDQQIPFAGSELSYPSPPHVEEYRVLFPGNHLFNQPSSGFYLHARHLQLPIVRRESELAEFLQKCPAYVLHRPSQDDSFQAKVRGRLALHDYTDMPNFEEISEQMNLTPRTLRRKLKEEGSSFSIIKSSLRREYAIKLLTIEDLRIVNISERLGFSETAAFCRAFKRWTGKTPSRWNSDKG